MARGAGFVQSLILSDIIGNPAHLIGSGPSIPQPITDQNHMTHLVEKYQISKYSNPLIRSTFCVGGDQSTNQIQKSIYPENNFDIIGHNKIILENFKKYFEKSPTGILSDSIEGIF